MVVTLLKIGYSLICPLLLLLDAAKGGGAKAHALNATTRPEDSVLRQIAEVRAALDCSTTESVAGISPSLIMEMQNFAERLDCKSKERPAQRTAQMVLKRSVELYFPPADHFVVYVNCVGTQAFD